MTIFGKNQKMRHKLPFNTKAKSYTLFFYVIFFLQFQNGLMDIKPKHVANFL